MDDDLFPVYSFTPERAIRVLRQYYALRLCTSPEDRAYADRLTTDYGEHRWFIYCLDAAARGFPVRLAA